MAYWPGHDGGWWYTAPNTTLIYFCVSYDFWLRGTRRFLIRNRPPFQFIAVRAWWNVTGRARLSIAVWSHLVTALTYIHIATIIESSFQFTGVAFKIFILWEMISLGANFMPPKWLINVISVYIHIKVFETGRFGFLWLFEFLSCGFFTAVVKTS